MTTRFPPTQTEPQPPRSFEAGGVTGAVTPPRADRPSEAAQAYGRGFVSARARQRLRRRVRIGLLLAPALAVVAVFFVAGVGQAVAQSLGYEPYLPGWH